MLPARLKKIDISVSLTSFFVWQDTVLIDICLWQTLTEEEQKLFRMYGKLPTHKNVLTKMQKVPLSFHRTP
jgi:hypothetical protein